MTTPSFLGSNPHESGYWDAMFDIIPFPVYVVDIATYQVICANRAMRLKTGAEAASPCYSAIYHLDQPCSFCKIAELQEDTGGEVGPLVFEHFNEYDDCWYQLRESLVTWMDGRKAKYSVSVDISVGKETQNALAEAHAELAIKNRDLNVALDAERSVIRSQRNFLAMVSHEFRTPLAIINSAAQLLDLYLGGNNEAEEELSKILRATHRMADLIDVYLADDRLDSALSALKVTDVDLAALLDEVLSDKMLLGGKARLTQEPPGPLMLQADSALLRVVVSNLIDNAIKYSPAAEPIDIALSARDDLAILSVKDRGLGIAEDERERIFEKFFRSSSADGVRGAGLGLFIVKRIVELHQGQVSVASRPGHGSTFTITLPIGSPGAA
jgi:signal transduction histidine kinase